MAHPFQCLLYCYRPEEDISQVLIAASGSNLHIFNVSNGESLCSWSSSCGILSKSQKDETPVLFPTDKTIREGAEHGLQRAPKRRKTSPGPIVSTESSSTEILVESDGSERNLHSNPIIKLVGTSDGRHIVAVTGDDKCLRVFELSKDGSITQISERIMPKRPCAIAVNSDDSSILCGDKFGDVYSLPLLGRPREPRNADSDPEVGSSTKTIKNGSQKFVPSATSLTVHTKKNLNALRQQQQISNREKSEKKTLAFDHKLLFGHVSLLTDLCCISFLSNSRSYILTSDRDEHVRVSRGEPYAHVIAGYCQGHTEFVSKICIIPSRPELLITGGGDDFLLLWDWLSGTVKQRVDLTGAILELKMRNCMTEEADQNLFTHTRFAVSNIHSLEIDCAQADERQTELIITFEGTPAVFFFTLDAQDQIRSQGAYFTEGNVINVTVLSNRSSVIYSVDHIHKPFSKVVDDNDSISRPLIGAIHFSRTERWKRDSDLCERLSPAIEETTKHWPAVPQTNVAKGKSLKELLYGLGSLRKHGSGVDAVSEPADEEEIAV